MRNQDLAQSLASAFDEAVNQGRTFLSIMEEVIEADKADQMMRARFKDQPFTPCSLKDEEAFNAGRPWMALDRQGNLHLIGSKVELP